MKLYDLKINRQDGNGNSHWRTIGTVFADDSAMIVSPGGKPATFVIDYPTVSGIIVPREKKEKAREAGENG